jgi:hypothetical protein
MHARAMSENRKIMITPQEWKVIFLKHWLSVNPRTRRLARNFNRRELQTVWGVSGAIWNGSHHACSILNAKTIEEAIGYAITAVYENSHPEFDPLRERIH